MKTRVEEEVKFVDNEEAVDSMDRYCTDAEVSSKEKTLDEAWHQYSYRC